MNPLINYQSLPYWEINIIVITDMIMKHIFIFMPSSVLSQLFTQYLLCMMTMVKNKKKRAIP